MKKLATATAAIALIGTPALAADMAVKAPAPAPAPVYNWSGWYAGLNAGASFGNVKTDFNVSPVAASPFFTGKNIASPNFGFSDRTYPSGFMGGGQIGYNWQYSPLIVVGLEADIQGALERDNANNLSNAFTATTTNNGILSPVTVTGASVTSYSTQIDWFGTVRARLGYVWGNGEVMSYVTGGLAYGEVKIHGTNTVSGAALPVIGSGPPTPAFAVTQTFGHSQVNTGWVLGYGTEGHLPLMPGNWTWKVEALYMDLGHVDTVGTTSGVFVANTTGAVAGGQVTSHSHFTDGILRGGLNYHF
jgi:outer membrane immunogenic protein